MIRQLARTVLFGFTVLTASQCYGPVREETPSRIFHQPTRAVFAGRYHLVYQHMDRALPESKAFPQSFLTLRADGTYTAEKYPIFVNPPLEDFKFQRFAHYKGTWRIFKSGTAANPDTGVRQDFWSIELAPIPGGPRREDHFEDLLVDAFINKALGRVEFLHLYTGDMDSGDVLSFERVKSGASGH